MTEESHRAAWTDLSLWGWRWWRWWWHWNWTQDTNHRLFNHHLSLITNLLFLEVSLKWINQN